MATIIIHNVCYREAAEPLIQKLQGKTFMKFEVGLAPAGGSFDVCVSTHRPDTSEEELQEMVMSVLCADACDQKTPSGTLWTRYPR